MIFKPQYGHRRERSHDAYVRAGFASAHRARRAAKSPPRGHDDLSSARRSGIHESADNQGRRVHRAQPARRELLRVKAGRAGRNGRARHHHRVARVTCPDPARWRCPRWIPAWHMVTPTVQRSQGDLTARCGHLLPTATHDYDQPPPGAPCERCGLLFLADFATDDSPVTHAQFPEKYV